MKKVISVLICLCTLIVNGQESNDTSKLDDITVIGIRATNKVPISQKTITKNEILKTYQGQEIPILFDNYPSIISQSDGGHSQGYTYFRIRGIDQTRINMTLNGVPLNEPEDQGIYTSNYPGFINGIKSIQIQRGVGTTTNGVASYGGSINFESDNGFERETNVSLTYGSFNSFRTNVSHSTGIKNNFSLHSNISYYSSDGYRYNSGGNGYSLFVSGGFFKEKEKLKFTTFTGRSKNGMAWLGVSEDDIKIDPRINYNETNAWDDFTQTLAQIQYINSKLRRNKITATVFYNRLDGAYDYNLDGERSLKLGSNFYGMIISNQYKTNHFTNNSGASFNKYDRKHIGRSSIYENYTNTGFKNEVSFFNKSLFDINKLSLFSDIQFRYTSFNYNGDKQIDNIYWSFVNPKFGIVYNVTNKNNYYFSVGHTKREPTRSNLFGGDDNLITLNKIKPEEVVDIELGYNYTSTAFNVQWNVYYMRFRNEIMPLGQIGPNSLPLMVNVDKSYRSGVEIDFKWQSPFNLIYFTSNANLSKNKVNNDGNKFKPLYTPNCIINNSIGANLKSIKLEIVSKYHSKSYIDFDNSFYLSNFVIFGSNIIITKGNFEFLGQINNIFSKKYYTNGYADIIDVENNKFGRFLFTNAPININGTVKLKFL